VTRASLIKGTALMCVVVLIWGTFLPVSKLVLAAVDPYWLTALRYGVAALCFVALLVAVEGAGTLAPEGKARLAFLFGSAGFAGFSILTYEGLRLTRPETGAMILALTPVLVALYQWRRLRRRPHGVTLACIAVALIGEALVVSRGDPARILYDGSSFGNGLIFLAALCWTIYTLGAQRLPDWSPLRYTAMSATLGWISIAAATGVATAIGHSGPPDAGAMRDLLWPIVYVTIVVSVVAMLCWNTAVRHIGALNASLFANFAPVVAYVIAVWQGHALESAEVQGAALVIGALVANNLFLRRQAAGAARPAAGVSGS
jgi:drug/metabolite transporter (DMT)-like permease